MNPKLTPKVVEKASETEVDITECVPTKTRVPLLALENKQKNIIDEIKRISDTYILQVTALKDKLANLQDNIVQAKNLGVVEVVTPEVEEVPVVDPPVIVPV